MAKLTKKEYILKAAKLYGLSNFEIEALEKHITGEVPNDFIERRNIRLFQMYEVYQSKEYNDRMDTDENGIINLDDYSFIVSKRRLLDSKIGEFWVISSNLDCFLATRPHSDNIKERFSKISEKNNFLLPQIAKQMNIPATVYYKGKYVSEKENKLSFLTKNFIQAGENVVKGDTIYRRKKDRRRVSFEAILESADKYVKKYYKKHKLPTEDLEKTREDIRRGLIKQTIFNKIAFNDNESNEKWGIIVSEDNKLRLAPLFSYDYCSGVVTSTKSHHRVLKRRKEDIESFMLEFGDEEWFRNWIRDEVIPLDINKAISDMESETGVKLTQEEEEYYKFTFEKTHSRAVDAFNRNFGSGVPNGKRKLDTKSPLSKDNSNSYDDAR